MGIEEVIHSLRKYGESLISYKLDAEFASAVTEAVNIIKELEADRDSWRKGYMKLQAEVINLRAAKAQKDSVIAHIKGLIEISESRRENEES